MLTSIAMILLLGLLIGWIFSKCKLPSLLGMIIAGIPKDMDYSVYSVNDSGNLEWSYSAYPPEESFVPYGFAGLTYELIEKSIDGTEYEDYIITYAQRIDSVLVWVRGEKEDFILAYPTRPDLVGLDAGGLYTLKELQGRLAAAYSN